MLLNPWSNNTSLICIGFYDIFLFSFSLAKMFGRSVFNHQLKNSLTLFFFLSILWFTILMLKLSYFALLKLFNHKFKEKRILNFRGSCYPLFSNWTLLPEQRLVIKEHPDLNILHLPKVRNTKYLDILWVPPYEVGGAREVTVDYKQ